MRLPRWDDVSNRAAPSPRAGAARADMNVAVTAGPEMGRMLMGAVEDWAVEAKRQREKADLVEATKAYSETTLAWLGSYSTAQEQAAADGKGFTATVQQQFDADMKARLEAAPESARPWLEQRLADLRTGMVAKAMEHEAGLRLAQQSRDLNDLVTLNANAVRTDPARLPEAIGLAEGAIEVSSLTAAAKAEARRQARSGIAFSALSGLNERDPSAARQALESGRFDGFLSAEHKNRLVNDNLTEINRRESEAKQAQALAAAEQRAVRAELREEARFALSKLGDGEDWIGTDDLIARAEKVDPKTAAALRYAKADVKWVQGLLKMPPADIAEQIRTVRAQSDAAPDAMVADTLSARAKRGEQVLKAVTAGLEKDPLALAASAGVVSLEQLNPTDPEAMRARVVAATKAAEHYGLPSVLPFTKDEVSAIGEALNEADAKGKVDILRGLRGLPDDHLARVLKDLEPKAPGFTVAAAVSADPTQRPQIPDGGTVATEILRGDSVRQSVKGIVPPDRDYLPVVEAQIGEIFRNDEGARQAVTEAALSVYAERMYRGGKTGQWDPTAMGEALRDVVGGIVEYGGRKLVPPSRGMDSDSFEDLLATMTPEDLTGALHPTGRDLTVDWLLDNATFSNAGAGRYFVHVGGQKVVRADDPGRAFVLDLQAVLDRKESR